MIPAKNRTRPSTATRASPLQRILETRRPRRVPFTSRQSDSTRPRCVPYFNGDEGVAAPAHFGDATPPVAFRSSAASRIRLGPVAFRPSTATRASPLQRILETRRPRRVPFISRQSDSARLRCVPPFDGDEGVAAPTHFGDATPPSRSVHQLPVGFDQAPLRSVLQRRRGRRRSNVFWRRDAPSRSVHQLPV